MLAFNILQISTGLKKFEGCFICLTLNSASFFSLSHTIQVEVDRGSGKSDHKEEVSHSVNMCQERRPQ